MNIVIGGAAGQGIDTATSLLCKLLARLGYGIYATKDYMSRVRGGYNFSRLQVALNSPWDAGSEIDILVCMSREAYQAHQGQLNSKAKVIFEPSQSMLPEGENRGVPVDFTAMARTVGSPILAGTVAAGAVLALLGVSYESSHDLLSELFSPELAAQNLTALKAGSTTAWPYKNSHQLSDAPVAKGPQLLLDGNQLLGMAAVASGCRFLSAYPMTPATGVMTYLAAKQHECGLVVEQAEDEIAAINMALGASYAGVRSMTCTSGGGFALMVEGVSLAGIIETPIVIVLAMRPGPATGLPTRTEQGDLSFALHGGHGEFPRIIMSATHIEDAFYRLNKAFDLADKYQVPVIFLTDQYFADTARTIAPLDFGKLIYEQHLVKTDEAILPYRRYRLTEDGISPRAWPGQLENQVVLVDSDEHDEEGHIIEDSASRIAMMNKRLCKLTAIASEMEEPELYGEDESEVLLVSWGSTYGAVRSAVDILNNKGKRAAMLHFADLYPLRTSKVTEMLLKARVSFGVEVNATGQFAALLKRETGLSPTHQILKYDGRAFNGQEIAQEVAKCTSPLTT